MDRLVAVLSVGSWPDGMWRHAEAITEEFSGAQQRLSSQLTALQGHYKNARTENRRQALQLSEEQGRTKRLHDMLCQLQGELFMQQGCGHRSSLSSLAAAAPAGGASRSGSASAVGGSGS